MSDQGEKTCPLCAEEMDLTDQQLKPCKCGYEICVWCWHHIMDMAEKDESEGRCPACRTPYNKEKIVGTAPNREKIVAEMSFEKKMKSHKGKSKTLESRKQLCSVRVIQRNLVYIVGLPLNLADEDILQHKEYFGQYGKVLKVSISRTAAGSIQQFPNNTCSVYITYSKEDEAVRCIQSVHGFFLDGRPLKACYGTTKYCHAWLRNAPCTNPDCLYLHEIGSEEDSFSKDEIISAYTRNRVQQITGVSNTAQRRSGTILPPPADNYCNNFASTAKPISKTTTNNSATPIIVSPPNTSSGRSAALPAGASWGARALNNQPPPASSPYSNGPLKSKPEMSNSSSSFSAAVASTGQSSLHAADRDKQLAHVDQSSNNKKRSKVGTPKPAMLQHVEVDDQVCVTKTTLPSPVPLLHSHNAAKEKDRHTPRCSADCESVSHRPDTAKNAPQAPGHNRPDTSKNIAEAPVQNRPDTAKNIAEAPVQNRSDTAKNIAEAPGQEIDKLQANISSLSIDRHKSSPLLSYVHSRDPLASEGKATIHADESCTENDKSDSRVDLKMQVVVTHEGGDGIPDSGHIQNPSLPLHSSTCSPFLSNSIGSVDTDMHIVDRKCDSLLQPSSSHKLHNGSSEDVVNNSADFGNPNKGSSSLSPADQRKFANTSEGVTTTADMGESSIISNILSLDFDPWDAPLTSPQNLAKLLGDSDKQQPSLILSSSLKLHTSNESRFSFAREERSIKQASELEPSLGHMQQSFHHPLNQDLSSTRSFQDNPGIQSGFSLIHNEDNGSVSSYPTFLSNNMSASRPQMSAPPGFSAPNRAPPPGFSSHERVEHNFSSVSGNQLLDSAVLQNQYQNPPGNMVVDNDGIELMDPAILAVVTEKVPIPSGLNSSIGLLLGQNFHTQQMNTFENELRLQLLMQRSLPPTHQNQRIGEGPGNFLPFHEAYGIPQRGAGGEQVMSGNISPFSQFSTPQSRGPVISNVHWDVWNGVNNGNDLGMAELFRTERMGLNNVCPGGYEDAKFCAPSSGNFYNRPFGI
ncbi:hypothetical protein DM860_000144 [Cuscuta australis]|uniref:RING-type domain-containing protein n=1 Tax=Cuscuta australis TaxID=267555 RepID=A0A328CXQ2_9ASTE|nr:hypothetical protein DM860_000144 [Cuscuta australis]